MQRWMISANTKKYHHKELFDKYGVLDWEQHLNYSVGDIVYIYCRSPIKKVMFKTRVLRESIPFKKEDSNGNEKDTRYALLEKIEYIDDDNLSLENLKEHGLKAAPQKGLKVSDELAEYIDKCFDYVEPEDISPDTDLPPKYYEGAVKTVKVNRYERNIEARKKCIEYHGSNCTVCGLSFEEMYGEIGKDYIQVHHIVPLNTIKEKYEVNYKTDLIPVCANCHAMLHRKLNGEFYSIKELKEIVKLNKNKKMNF